MKKIAALIVFVLAATLILSATTPAPAKTLEHLQAAFNGESNAHARYLEFAKQADAEGCGPVASLFRAAARAASEAGRGTTSRRAEGFSWRNATGARTEGCHVQWRRSITPLTFTASAPGVPLLVSGTTVASTLVTLPSASFSQPVHSTTMPYFRRTLLPGKRRKKPLGGTSAKSSRSIHSSGPRLKLRWPSSGWCGWAGALQGSRCSALPKTSA